MPELPTARLLDLLCLNVQTTVTRCDNVTCGCLSRPTLGDTHTSSAWPATGDHASCLLSRNPAHQQHQPVDSASRLMEQQPAVSHQLCHITACMAQVAELPSSS